MCNLHTPMEHQSAPHVCRPQCERWVGRADVQGNALFCGACACTGTPPPPSLPASQAHCPTPRAPARLAASHRPTPSLRSFPPPWPRLRAGLFVLPGRAGALACRSRWCAGVGAGRGCTEGHAPAWRAPHVSHAPGPAGPRPPAPFPPCLSCAPRSRSRSTPATAPSARPFAPSLPHRIQRSGSHPQGKGCGLHRREYAHNNRPALAVAGGAPSQLETSSVVYVEPGGRYLRDTSSDAQFARAHVE